MSNNPENSLINEVYVGRQPIFNSELDVFGYELLFRSGHTATANVIDGNQATSQVIINTFLEIGLEQITNQRHAFINLTRDFLLGSIPLPLNKEMVILEVLEDVTVDDELIEAITNLKNQGFVIALDDFVLDDANKSLLPLADIVKVDLMSMSEDKLREQVKQLKQHDLQLLAEKIETQDEFTLCKELGFKYFQGYYFCKPRVISGKQLPANRLALLEMISKLQNPDCEIKELETIISRDVAISYKLLRIINSSFFGFSSKVESIQKALVMLGLTALRNWVTVIGLSQVDDKPPELINISLSRAKMCELLAPAMGCQKDAAFTVGLFSMLDVLMDRPLDELLEQLPLAEEIIEALIQNEGILGKILDIVMAYEQGNWQHLDDTITLDADTVRNHYLESLAWSDEITSSLQST